MNRQPDDEVATLIELAGFCRTFNSLPNAGGVLDQPYVLLRKLAWVIEAHNEKEEIEVQRAGKRGKV